MDFIQNIKMNIEEAHKHLWKDEGEFRMNKSYESKSAIIILYGSSEYKSLDKKLNGQLDTMCAANSIDSKDTLEARDDLSF